MHIDYKYLRIAEKIRTELKSGKLQYEVVLPPAKRLAEMFLVNKRTILKAIVELEKGNLVSPLIGKYRKINKGPRWNGKPYDIAVIGYGHSPNGDYINYSKEFFDSLAMEFQKNNVFLKMIVVTGAKSSPPLRIKENIPDAYICIGDIKADIVSSLNRPVFYFDSSYSVPQNSCCFQMNGEKPVFEAIEYLLKKGHRKIGYVFFRERPQYFHYEEQLTAFRNAMDIYDLPSPSGIIEARTGDLSVNIEQFVDKSIGTIKNLHGLLLCSSFFAPPFLEALRERGVSVPENLSVISLGGFHDPNTCTPRITAFRHNCTKTAEIICRYVFNILKGNINPVSKYTLDILELVEGESVKEL
jgi:hypothetical protein